MLTFSFRTTGTIASLCITPTSVPIPADGALSSLSSSSDCTRPSLLRGDCGMARRGLLLLLFFFITCSMVWCFFPRPLTWHFILFLQSSVMRPLPRQLSLSHAKLLSFFWDLWFHEFRFSQSISTRTQRTNYDSRCLQLRPICDLWRLRRKGILIRGSWLKFGFAAQSSVHCLISL